VTVKDASGTGKPTYIKEAEPSPSGNHRCVFICACGNEFRAALSNINNGHTKSCGCLRGTHKMSKSGTYSSWLNMKSRCNTESSTGYEHYGGRGITICDRWDRSFESFYKDMGERSDSCILERLDVDGDYCPENCIWATQKV